MKPAICALLVTVALAGCGGARTAGGADNRAGGAGTCLPRDIFAAPLRAPAPSTDDGDESEPPPRRTFRIVNHDGRAHVCVDHQACWEVDLGSGTVHDAAVVDDAGTGQRIEVRPTAQGLCPAGYCVPGATADEDGTASFEVAVGPRVALVLAGEDGLIFGLDHQLRGKLDWAAAGEHGPSAGAGSPMVVGDLLFTGDFDAGPHADVHAWRSDGSPLGPIGDPARRDDYGGEFELNTGGIALLSDHEVAFVEHAAQRVFLVDASDATTTVWTRKLAPVPGCSDDAIRLFLDPTGVDFDFALQDGTIPPPCLDALQRVHGRFADDAGLARTADGALVALARDVDGAALVHFDRAGAVSREVPLPICAQ